MRNPCSFSIMGLLQNLIIAVVEVMEGAEESEVVKHLLRLRDSLDTQESGQERTAEVDAARAEVINIVNNFFHEKLMAVPTIQVYIDTFQSKN